MEYMMSKDVCEYVYTYDTGGGDAWYHTSCHHDIDLLDSGVEDWIYCPFCGKKKEEKDE